MSKSNPSPTHDSEDWLWDLLNKLDQDMHENIANGRNNLRARERAKQQILAHYTRPTKAQLELVAKIATLEQKIYMMESTYLKPEDVERTVDTPELRQLMAENKRLIEAGDALYECASYTGREFDGTHRLLSAAAHWLDVRGKNSGAYQAQLSKLNREEEKDAKT